MIDIENPNPLYKIFFGYALKQQIRIIRERKRFVHYTGAEAAVGMIKNAEVWMRKSTTMNDFSEIEHGLSCLRYAYHNEAGIRFKAVLDSLHIGIVAEIERLFDSWLPHFRLQTYLTCISEHEDEEDTTGRLSMWRAYGNVAIVLNNDVFMSETDALKAYSSPVSYLSPEGFVVAFNEITDRILKNADYLRGIDRQLVINNVFSMLRFAVLCTKHPGFKEEREWRIVYSPTYQASSRITKAVEIVRGVPQTVCKIPLADAPEDRLEGMTIPRLVNRVIIGPSQYPFAQLEAFVSLLQARGVDDAHQRVWASDIPIRQNP